MLCLHSVTVARHKTGLKLFMWLSVRACALEQVLVEQCQQLGLDIERPPAPAVPQADAVGRKKLPTAAVPGPSAEISSIHR